MYAPPGYARPSLLATSPYCQSKMRRPEPRVELHSVDLATWDDGVWGDTLFLETLPDELDEPWPYRFKGGDHVWIRYSDGEWCRGKIVGHAKQGRTRSDDGLYWNVEYFVAKCKVRKWFAPLNGDIKPDNEHTRRMLLDAGWLDSDTDQ